MPEGSLRLLLVGGSGQGRGRALHAEDRGRLRIELSALQRRLGLTTVFVTHDQAEAMALSDRIALMFKGRLIETGTPAEIYSRPQSRFAAEFVGIANLLSGTLSDDGRERFVDTALGRFAALGDGGAEARAFHAMGVDFIEANDAGMLAMSVEEIAKALAVTA